MKIPNEVIQRANENSLSDNAIIVAYRGSIAHGMYVPKNNPDSIDDKDLMAITIPSVEWYLGIGGVGGNSLFPVNGTQEIMYEDWDVVIYELKKFLQLLSKGNPNVLSILWLEENFYLRKTAVGQMLIDNRDAFVGKHVYHSFSGYAYSQLHKMEHGGKYQGHASAKRKELVQRYGYDCKNASHLIRLLRMGMEFLTDGELQVQRQDAKQLLEIKNGQWSLEQVKQEAEKLFKLTELAYVNSKLPNKPNMKRINELGVHLIREHLGI